MLKPRPPAAIPASSPSPWSYSYKLMLVSRLENLVSDRRLVEHCSLWLNILYFLGYEVEEDLPRHSTISRTRPLGNYHFKQLVQRTLLYLQQV